MDETEMFFKFADRFGVPMAVLAALAIGLWRIGLWMKPHIDATLSAQRELCQTLQENDSKHIKALYTLKGLGETGHQLTHQKLEIVQRDLTEIKTNIAK